MTIYKVSYRDVDCHSTIENIVGYYDSLKKAQVALEKCKVVCIKMTEEADRRYSMLCKHYEPNNIAEIEVQ